MGYVRVPLYVILRLICLSIKTNKIAMICISDNCLVRHTDDVATLGDGRWPDHRRQFHLQHLLFLRPTDAPAGGREGTEVGRGTSCQDAK